MDASGFYRHEPADEGPGELLHAPNFVHTPDGLWTREDRESPPEGWTWHDSEEQAREHYQLPDSDEDEEGEDEGGET